jgi:quercetin dioxygenase-like cupin family protein
MSGIESYVMHTDDLPVETFDWGTLQWLCNEKISPGSAQTVGLCHIQPGQRNPVHYHPNCEEILYMLSGSGLHSFNDETVELRPGSTICIPAGVRHNLANTGTDPIVCLIAFSSGQRETVFLE